jgi:hypothetical protein
MDRAVPPHHAAMLALGIPSARMVQVAGAGHFLICSHPEELVQIIKSWFADTDDVAPLANTVHPRPSDLTARGEVRAIGTADGR